MANDDDRQWKKNKKEALFLVVFDKRLKQLVFCKLLIVSHCIPSSDKNVYVNILNDYNALLFLFSFRSIYYY